MDDILDLPLEEIIAEKIKRQENIIRQATKEIENLTNKLELLSPHVHKLIKATIANESKSDGIKGIEPESPKIGKRLFDLSEKPSFDFPSQREMREKIFSLLNEKKAPIKTSQIIDYYYGNADLDSDTRLDLTRRFSVTLNQLTKKGEVYSEKMRGEKGYFYTTYKELVGKTG